MKRDVIRMLMAIGVSLVVVALMFFATWCIVSIYGFLGKWVFVLFALLFLMLTWTLYNGLGNKSDDEEEVGDDE